MNTSIANTAPHVLPSPDQLRHARSKLLTNIPATGLGEEAVQHHLQHDIAPGLNHPSHSPHFYGFVTGGTTPAARSADNFVTEHDQNVQVHLPNETVCTDVEDAALRMVCDLLDLASADWPHRTFSTGATASNILGLACGREFVLREAGARTGHQDLSVADDGLPAAMRKAGIDTIQILTTAPHSSLRKAASLVGLGRTSIHDVSLPSHPHRFDFDALETALRAPKTASIIAVSCAEVNTGRFATANAADFHRLRALCDQHAAWLHVDAAFGLLARALPASHPGVAGLESADSIAGDAHKLLNVPYDCGIFLARHLALGTRVCANTGAAYLATPPSSPDNATIPSPLNVGLENSRRFRALPVYATLLAYGRAGYAAMLERQIALARAIAAYIAQSAAYELLNGGSEEIFIIVLFRARDEALNAELVRRINGSRRVYVSGTQWEGGAAARFAVASWQVSVERDFEVVREVLEGVAG